MWRHATWDISCLKKINLNLNGLGQAIKRINQQKVKEKLPTKNVMVLRLIIHFWDKKVQRFRLSPITRFVCDTNIFIRN